MIIFIEYLFEKVGKAPPDLGYISIEPLPPMNYGSFFNIGELNIVLRSLRTGRSPDPNGIIAELFKGSPYILKLFLLNHLNHYLSTSITPDSWALSEIVMIIKQAQGHIRDLSN